jgi:hypothetical protein
MLTLLLRAVLRLTYPRVNAEETWLDKCLTVGDKTCPIAVD